MFSEKWRMCKQLAHCLKMGLGVEDGVGGGIQYKSAWSCHVTPVAGCATWQLMMSMWLLLYT